MAWDGELWCYRYESTSAPRNSSWPDVCRHRGRREDAPARLGFGAVSGCAGGFRQTMASSAAPTSRASARPVSEKMLAVFSSCYVPGLTPDKHKGQCGRVAIVGGSDVYVGAPYYAGVAALKAGADLLCVYPELRRRLLPRCCPAAAPPHPSTHPPTPPPSLAPRPLLCISACTCAHMGVRCHRTCRGRVVPTRNRRLALALTALTAASTCAHHKGTSSRRGRRPRPSRSSRLNSWWRRSVQLFPSCCCCCYGRLRRWCIATGPLLACCN